MQKNTKGVTSISELADGFLMVQQSHCSDYIFTTKAIAESSKTGNSGRMVENG